MLAILAPAKRMAFDSDLAAPVEMVQPLFPEKTRQLALLATSLGLEGVGKLMKVSESLAEKTIRNFEAFSFGQKKERVRPAVFAFKGDTFKGLDADLFTREELSFAEETIRILSGFYGILSPLTLIEPYRFEMGLRIEVDHFKKISNFWKDSVTDELNRQLLKHKEKKIISLASAEYMAAVDKKKLAAEIIDILFQEKKNGKLKTIPIYSKKARGMMARYIVQERIEEGDRLKKFNGEGYQFAETLSDDKKFVFIR